MQTHIVVQNHIKHILAVKINYKVYQPMKHFMIQTLPIILFFLLNSCSFHNLNEISIPANDPTAIDISANIVDPTKIVISPTTTHEKLYEYKNCLKIEKDTENIKVQGVIVFKGNHLLKHQEPDNFPLLWNPSNENKVFLDTSKGYLDRNLSRSFAVSPDRKKLAFFTRKDDGSKTQLYILGADGKIILSIPITDMRYWGVKKWLDNDSLMISTFEYEDDSELTPSSIAIVNPSTGEIHNLRVDFPDMAKYVNYYKDWFDFSLTSYSPDLTRVVYPIFGKKEFIALWDMSNNREISRMTMKSLSSEPVWRSDSEYFVINLGIDEQYDRYSMPQDELFIVSKNGDGKRLTYLTKTYPVSDIGSYSWSPDNRYIAFWFSPGEKREYWLRVLDTNTGQIKDWCIRGHPDADGAGRFFWSQDGFQIIFYSLSDTHLEGRSILVDIPSERAFEINRSNGPVEGWMNEIP